MPSATYHFPNGFLWGTATSSHQVEGGNVNNNWHLWEQAGHSQHRSGSASDWWSGRWKEDLDLAAKAGQSAHRLSVEWSRIQPAPDRWDDEALNYYREILIGMRERGITPMITLHHFTDPIWLTDSGAWEIDRVVRLFERFTAKVVAALKDLCDLWCTINEPNVYFIEGYLRRNYPPGKSDLKLGLVVQANMVRAHAAAYRQIHQIQPKAKVGYALHFRPMVPAHPWSPLDRFMRNLKFSTVNMAFPSALQTGRLVTPLGKIMIPEARGTQDYLGLNYYSMDTVVFDLRKKAEVFSRNYFPAGSDVSEAGTNVNEPEGFFKSFQWAVKTHPGLPIFVTENGIEDSSDGLRRRFLAQHVHAMWRAVNFNWPVQGYFFWTLVDNFEWERGWNQRFGLWELDPVTQVRTKRPSADLYAAIAKENGLSSAMVEEFCPEVLDKLFPR